MIPDILGWQTALPYLLAAWVGGYLVGSIPVGLYLSRLFGHGDIRKIGSGNIGATNMLRTGDRRAAALTLALDLAKGAVATAIAAEWGPLAAAAAGAGAGIGHCLPLWLRFRGGKGVATSFGAILVWHWPSAALALLAWLLVVIAFRYVSLASLTGCLAAVALLAWHEQWDYVPAALVLAILVIFRHAPNIRRLISGIESRIRFAHGGDEN